MFVIIYCLLFAFTFGHECSSNSQLKFDSLFLCQEKLNSTAVRIRLHLNIRRRQFHFYAFTFRTIVLQHHTILRLEDRLERRITNLVKFNNINKTENHTLNILSLAPGRYEVCVDLFHNNQQKFNDTFYVRSSNSCLHLAWQIPKNDQDQPNILIQMLVIIATIILLISIAFFNYAQKKFFQSRKSPIIETAIELSEDEHKTICAKSLVHKHLVEDIKPWQHLVRHRVRQRYAHHSP